MIGRVRSGYSKIILRRRALVTVVGFVLAVAVIGFSLFFLIRKSDRIFGGDFSSELKSWNSGDYAEAYQTAERNLSERPLSSFWLSMKGMAAYQLAVAQINQVDSMRFIDESIAALRKALMVGDGSIEAKVKYVLGKAYYRKGSEYADAAADFLEQSIAGKFIAPDTYEHLGLAYASLHDYRASVVAFSKALGDSPSDLLLLSIARSYLELGEFDQAKAYLVRCADTSKDAALSAQARLLLGQAYSKQGLMDEAEKEYLAVLSVDARSADAHYALGDLYAEEGDTVKARAEWRKAIRIDPTHGPSRSRLGM